jgi:hypothetical protein
VLVWFQSRYQGQKVATSWIYRVSRHPQYLGWILWSYGFILYTPYDRSMKMSWSVPSSLPWLLMTMVIVGICLLEEVRMMERTGGQYAEYRSRSPFLFPLPRWLKQILKAPARLVVRKPYPETPGQVFRVTLFYTGIFILLSLFWVDLGLRKSTSPQQEQALVELSELTSGIRTMGEDRRGLWREMSQLPAYGDQGTDSLLALAMHTNPIIREFSMQLLARQQVRQGEDMYITNLTDSIWRVRSAATDAVAAIRSGRAVDTLIRVLEDPALNRNAFAIYGALGTIGDPKALPILAEGLEEGPHYDRVAALDAILKIDPAVGISYAIEALQDPEVKVRRNAVMQCILSERPEAIHALEAVTRDPDFEVRFYARQGLKRLEKS